jgi:hypothetical protein
MSNSEQRVYQIGANNSHLFAQLAAILFASLALLFDLYLRSVVRVVRGSENRLCPWGWGKNSSLARRH